MLDTNDRVTVGGQTLTARVWSLVAAAAGEAGIPTPVVVQGGYKGGSGGAAASAGTHDQGDVFDLRTRDLTTIQITRLVLALRRRDVCAWHRPATKSWGPHIHGVVRDSHDGLSPAARQQVRDYDAGRNGLANDGADPHPRPTQHPYVQPWEELMTPAEMTAAVTAGVRAALEAHDLSIAGAGTDAVSHEQGEYREQTGTTRLAKRMLAVGRMIAAVYADNPGVQAAAKQLESTTYPGEL